MGRPARSLAERDADLGFGPSAAARARAAAMPSAAAPMAGAVAEFERTLMLERQREGIAKAKGEGRCKGRKPTARAKAGEVRRLHGQGVRPTEIAKRLGIGRASVYRVLQAEPGP